MKRSLNPNDYNDPNWNIENYDVLRHYIDIHEDYPNNTAFMGNNFNKGFIRYDKLMKEIEALTVATETIFKASTFNMGVRKHYMIVDGNFLLMENIHMKRSENLILDEVCGEYVPMIGNLTILHTDTAIPTDLKQMIENCMVKYAEVPTIAIIGRDSNGFFLNEIPMETKISHELQLHYGENFPLFHEKLVEKLATTNKGLTLFHGKPGTGKSSYIRKLIHDLKQSTSKKIIIIPNSLITYLADPEFNTFLLETVESFQYDDEIDYEFNEDQEVTIVEPLVEAAPTKGMILILEDAESVLMKREDSYNNQGTSNILNLTDGLLNDIFGIQIIATYNSSDDKIDDAMKRSRRLIAKKNFKSLPKEAAKKLAVYLGVPEDDVKMIKGDMNVCDVYALIDKETESVLIEKDSSTLGNVGF
jgi:hypothetical protein